MPVTDHLRPFCNHYVPRRSTNLIHSHSVPFLITEIAPTQYLMSSLCIRESSRHFLLILRGGQKYSRVFFVLNGNVPQKCASIDLTAAVSSWPLTEYQMSRRRRRWLKLVNANWVWVWAEALHPIYLSKGTDSWGWCEWANIPIHKKADRYSLKYQRGISFINISQTVGGHSAPPIIYYPLKMHTWYSSGFLARSGLYWPNFHFFLTRIARQDTLVHTYLQWQAAFPDHIWNPG